MLFLSSFTCTLTPHTLPTSWCVCNRPSWGQNALHYTNQGSQKTLANGHATQLLSTSFFLFLFPLPSTSPHTQGSHLFLSSFLDTEFKFQHLHLLTAWNWATSLNSLWPHFPHLEKHDTVIIPTSKDRTHDSSGTWQVSNMMLTVPLSMVIANIKDFSGFFCSKFLL